MTAQASWCSAMLMAVAVAMAAPSAARAQDAQTVVIVRTRDTLAGLPVEITINGRQQAGVTGANGQARVVFPFLAEGPAQIRVVTRRIGLTSRVWTNDLDLNGSGVIEYTLNPDGSGSIGQWPAVIWLASRGTLDVVVNNTSHGSTRTRTKVPPDEAQNAEWRRDGRVVCRKSFSLSMNGRRTYTCDPDSGAVTEQ